MPPIRHRPVCRRAKIDNFLSELPRRLPNSIVNLIGSWKINEGVAVFGCGDLSEPIMDPGPGCGAPLIKIGFFIFESEISFDPDERGTFYNFVPLRRAQSDFARDWRAQGKLVFAERNIGPPPRGIGSARLFNFSICSDALINPRLATQPRGGFLAQDRQHFLRERHSMRREINLAEQLARIPDSLRRGFLKQAGSESKSVLGRLNGCGKLAERDLSLILRVQEKSFVLRERHMSFPLFSATRGALVQLGNFIVR